MNDRNTLLVMAHVWLVGSFSAREPWIGAAMLLFGGVILYCALSEPHSIS
jgi:hypothetical protein